ncbi:hypothetical protein [Embleya sp. NPDC020630]|uniref:hypothetical protein n=1 Tax=Embleya sp. NPDC020630 TaxID=3363979 RepID=UPI0037BC446F
MTASTAAAALPPRAAAAPEPTCRTCRGTGVYLADPAWDCPACPGPRYPDDEGDDE